MAELYKIKPSGTVFEFKKSPFSNETNEMEDFIMNNEKLLGNAALINHQIILPDNKRIDIWGLDLLDLCPIIVELKNVVCGLEVIPQILPYYGFVKSNPDTLKYRALTNDKFMKKLKELDINQEKLTKIIDADPKVILIAPEFTQDLLDTLDYISFKIEPIKITRYEEEVGQFLVTTDRPDLPLNKPITVRVMEDWDWEKYKKEGIANKKIKTANGLKDRIDTIIKDEEIDLKPIFRKLYIPYQIGRNNVFWIDLSYTSWETGDVLICFKLDKKPDLKAENISIECTKSQWKEDYNQWYIFFNKVVDLSPPIPIFKRSYEYVTGAKTSD
jgi:hypothetical protein